MANVGGFGLLNLWGLSGRSRAEEGEGDGESSPNLCLPWAEGWRNDAPAEHASHHFIIASASGCVGPTSYLLHPSC